MEMFEIDEEVRISNFFRINSEKMFEDASKSDNSKEK